MKRLLRTFLFVSIGVVVGFSQTGAAVLSGDILVADFSAAGGQGAIIRVDPATGVQTIHSSGGLFGDPVDVAVDNSGRIFVADALTSSIIEVDAGTGAQTSVSVGSNLISPTGVAAGVGDYLWVTDAAANALIRVNKNTGDQMLVHAGSPFSAPFGVSMNKFTDIFVIDRTAGTFGSLFKFVLGAGAPILISTGQDFRQPFGIAIDQGVPFFPGNDPGGVYIADREAGAGPGAVIFIDVNGASGSNQTILSSGDFFSEASGVAMSQTSFPTTPKLYAVDFGAKAVIEVDPTTGVQTLLSAFGNFNNPFRCAVFPEAPVQAEVTTWGKIKGQYR